MRRLFIATISLVILFAFPLLYSQSSKYEGKTVKKIIFEGLKNTNEDDLLYVIKTTVNYPLKAQEIREDIKKIFKKGKFESITVEIEEQEGGVRLKFVCRERPVVKEIKFKGTRRDLGIRPSHGHPDQGGRNHPEGLPREERQRRQEKV